MRLVHVLAVLLLGSVASQSLPPCANKCVSQTKTRCKPTDFVCACSDGKYLPRLTRCVDKTCDTESRRQAFSYLASLCEAVGHPVDEENVQAGLFEKIANIAHIPRKIVFAIRQVINKRQGLVPLPSPIFPPSSSIDSGFSSLLSSATATTVRETTSTASLSTEASNTGTSSTRTGPLPTNTGGENKGSGGLSTGAKIGISVGVPLSVALVVGLITLGFFLGRRQKRKDEATGTQPPQDLPAMVHQPYKAGVPGLAELDQSAQYLGHEMPTKHNTAEMPVGSPQPGTAQPAFGWGQAQGAQPQYGHQPPPLQRHYPPHGQEWVTQAHQSPAELPERIGSPPQ